MPISKLTPEGNYSYLDERIRALARTVPEAVADGKINWEKLREVLGDAIEEEDASEEHFGLSWPGKREARKLAAQPSRGTLVPVPGEGVNEDDTENIFIEGENLEVMKLMLKSYAGKIKMIYIDPPYNTGNDFIYNDNFADPLEAYLKYTGVKGEGGELLTTNTRADGRFHSKWLNMMYPRLLLAHKLLRDDGVIFISIGKDEVHHLVAIVNEIFGEENFISIISRMMKSGGSKGRFFTPNIDYILVFSRDINYTKNFRVKIPQRQIERYYTHVESERRRQGELYGEERVYVAGLDSRPNQRYWVECPDGSFVIPPGNIFPKIIANGKKITPSSEDGVWKWIFETYKKEFELGNIVFKETNTTALIDSGGNKAKWNIYNKVWLKDQQEKGAVPANFILKFENRKSAAELKTINIPFDFAKPSGLINYLIEISGLSNNEIVLDFFSGAATTAHSIFRCNAEDWENRQFILVQLPEKTHSKSEAFKAGFNNICEIGKERIRRVIEKMEADETINTKEITKLDLGFKVFKYTRSNYKKWQDEEANVEKVETLFDNTINPLTDGWQSNDLLTEILLLEGFPLTSKVKIQDQYLKNQIYLVSAPDFCAHNLLVCLDEAVHDSTVSQLTMEEKDILICLDSALTDEAKARLKDRFNVHVI